MNKALEEQRFLKVQFLFKSKKYKNAIKEANTFLDICPNNIRVRFMRARSFRRTGKFAEAINDLNYILNIDKNNQHALIELYFLYYFLNRYEEALKLLPKLYLSENINSYSVAISELVMKKQLGLDKKMKKGNKCDYVVGQILSYSTNKTLEHIQKHTNINNKDEKISIFNQNIDINYLFNIVRQNIDNSKKVNTEEILELHYFPISNVGIYKDTACNYIKVVVVPNTNNIISMYPTNDVEVEYVSNIDIDYNKLFKKEEQKVKKLSRVDKFNKRYNM